MKRRPSKEATWEEVDFTDMNNPVVKEVFSRNGGWRPHDPMVMSKRFFLVVKREKGMFN